MEKHCVACGVPLRKEEDIHGQIDEGPLCEWCITPDGSVKNCEVIFESVVKFFNESVPDTDREFAERITRKNMNNLPYWKGKDIECLKGDEATDEEFKTTLDKLHEEIEKGNVKL
jgi:hypothetical protein